MIFTADKLTRIIAWNFGGDHPFLVLDEAGLMATSEDGIEWTEVEEYTGPLLRVGAWGADLFLAAATNPAAIWLSDDGQDWVEVPGHPFTGLVIRDIVFGNERFLVTAVDLATQENVTAAVFFPDNETWSDTVTPPLSGEEFNYSGAGFADGKFVIFGSQSFTEEIRQVIGYDFFLDQPEYGDPVETNWTKSRLTRSALGLVWGALEDPFNGIDEGEAPEITICDPSNPEDCVTIPSTDPPVSTVPTSVQFMANNNNPDVTAPVLVAQTTNVPAQSFAVCGPGSSTWSISPAELRNVNRLAFGTVPKANPALPPDNLFVALVSDVDANLGYGTSKTGMTWQHTVQDELPAGPGAPPIAFGNDIFMTARGPFIYTGNSGNDWESVEHGLDATNFINTIY